MCEVKLWDGMCAVSIQGCGSLVDLCVKLCSKLCVNLYAKICGKLCRKLCVKLCANEWKTKEEKISKILARVLNAT